MADRTAAASFAQRAAQVSKVSATCLATRGVARSWPVTMAASMACDTPVWRARARIEQGALRMARRRTASRVISVLDSMSSRAVAVKTGSPERVKPGQHVSSEVSLGLGAEMKDRDPEPLDLARLELEPARHLIPRENCVGRGRQRHGKRPSNAPRNLLLHVGLRSHTGLPVRERWLHTRALELRGMTPHDLPRPATSRLADPLDQELRPFFRGPENSRPEHTPLGPRTPPRTPPGTIRQAITDRRRSVMQPSRCFSRTRPRGSGRDGATARPHVS